MMSARWTLIPLLLFAALVSPSESNGFEWEIGFDLRSPVDSPSGLPWHPESIEGDIPGYSLSGFTDGFGGSKSSNRFGLILERKTASVNDFGVAATSLQGGWRRAIIHLGKTYFRVGASAGVAFFSNEKDSSLGNGTFLFSPAAYLVVPVDLRFSIVLGARGIVYVAYNNRTFPFDSGAVFSVGVHFSPL